MKSISIVLFLNLMSTLVLAETVPSTMSLVPDVAMSKLACKSFDVDGSERVGFVSTWVSCRSHNDESYWLTGLTLDGEVAAELKYQARDGRVNLTVKYLAGYGELNAEYVSGSVILDAVYSDGEKTSLSAGAQLALHPLKCTDFPKAKGAESMFWSTTSSSAQGAPSASVTAFYQDPAAKATATLLQKLFSDLFENNLLERVSPPMNWRSFTELGFVESSRLSFGLLQDSIDSHSELQGMGDCVLLALGATGAIIGAIKSNPDMGAACSASCGAALVCLATLAGGGSVGTACGAATGGCLYCVGVGYSKNFSNCFRHFTEMY